MAQSVSLNLKNYNKSSIFLRVESKAKILIKLCEEDEYLGRERGDSGVCVVDTSA